MFSLQNRMFTIVGLHESGKTVLAKFIASKFNAIIFDPLGEYDSSKFDVYRPKAKGYPEVTQEAEEFIRYVKRERKWNLVHFSEASRIFPNMKPLMPVAREFFDTYRHDGFAVGFDCRRPVQLNTDLIETSKDIFVFSTKGLRDVEYFSGLNREIGDLPFTIPSYHFIHITQDRSFRVCAPVPLIN